jgi:hypothetical protein
VYPRARMHVSCHAFTLALKAGVMIRAFHNSFWHVWNRCKVSGMPKPSMSTLIPHVLTATCAHIAWIGLRLATIKQLLMKLQRWLGPSPGAHQESDRPHLRGQYLVARCSWPIAVVQTTETFK